MSNKCAVYCLNEACRYCIEENSIFGKCSHPAHQNLQPCDERTALSLETCPWTTTVLHCGDISEKRKEQLRNAAPFPCSVPRIGYYFRAKGTGANISLAEMRMLDLRMISFEENHSSHLLCAQVSGKMMRLQSYFDIMNSEVAKGNAK